MTRPLHQSDAKLAIDCLARYRHERLTEAPTGGLWASVGTAVHAGIEAGYVGTATGNRDILECALEGLGVWWATNEEDLPLRVLTEADAMLRKAYHPESRLWLRLPSPPQSVQVELKWAMDEEFRACAVDSPDAAYAGIVDYVEWGSKGVILADHKSIRAMVSNDDLATDLQGWLYCLWAVAQFGQDVTWKLNLIRHGYSAKHLFVKDGSWVKRAQRFFRSIRNAVIEAERDDHYPETTGDGCGWCARRYQCESLRELTVSGSVPEDADPETIGRNHLALSKLSRQYTAAAKKLAEESHIPVGIGKVLGFRPGTKKAWTLPLVEILASLRADDATDEDLARWFPGTSISTKTLEVAAVDLIQRGAPECEPYEFVDRFRERVASVTFTSSPQPEEEETDD